MNDGHTRITAPTGFDGQATRRDYYFKTRNAAREFRLRIKRWKAEQKYPTDSLSFDDSDKRWLAYLRAHVGTLELLPAIVTHWERTAKPITRRLKVEELCKAFVLYREDKGLDNATLSEDRYISRRLQKHLGGYMAHELGVAEIRSFLDTAKTSHSLEHKLYKVGSLIFAYGKEQRVLVLNPFDEIDRPKVAYTVPEILESAQFKTLLETAEEEVPELIPYLAMAGFAGVRRSELVREYAEDQVLKWEDVDWQKHLITVRHEVAKQTSRKMGNRRFVPMEAALLHWLGPYRKKEGLLVPLVDSAVRRRMKKLCLHSKVNLPNNALRHSYASYWLARSSKEGLGELSKRMGNSEAVCKRHYLETLTREEGKSWFALRRLVGVP
jgi:site-specific recombinase XerD